MKTTICIFFLLLFANAYSQQEALPDLKLHNLTYEFKSKYPINPVCTGGNFSFRLTPGDQVFFTFKVSNNGQSGSGKFTLYIELTNAGEVHKYQKSYENIESGKDVSFSFTETIKANTGVIGCYATINLHEKNDWNESNNSYSQGGEFSWDLSYVQDYLKPDFHVEISSPNSTRPLTRPVKIVVTVSNRGHARAPATKLKLTCREKDTKIRNVPSLPPGHSISFDFEHKWYTLGTKRCTAEVNYNQNIEESKCNVGNSGQLNNGQNKATLTVYIK